MKRSKTLRAWSSSNNVSNIIGTIKWILATRQLLWVIAIDLSNFNQLTFFVADLVGGMQRVNRPCRPKKVPCHIVIVEGVELSTRSCVRSLRLCPLDIVYCEDVPCLVILFNSWFSPFNIFVVYLITNELGRCNFSILHLRQFIFRVQGV